MKCKCGGKLEKINIQTYKCKICGLKYAVALAPLPLINTVTIGPSKEYLDKIESEILNAYRIPSKYFNE